MDKETAIKLFEDRRVRVLWDEDQKKMVFLNYRCCWHPK